MLRPRPKRQAERNETEGYAAVTMGTQWMQLFIKMHTQSAIPALCVRHVKHFRNLMAKDRIFKVDFGGRDGMHACTFETRGSFMQIGSP